MILVFRGDPQELASGKGLSRQSITLEGVTFVMGEPRDASGLSEKLRAKLAKNNHFEVVADFDGESVEVVRESDDLAEEAAEAAELATRLQNKPARNKAKA